MLSFNQKLAIILSSVAGGLTILAIAVGVGIHLNKKGKVVASNPSAADTGDAGKESTENNDDAKLKLKKNKKDIVSPNLIDASPPVNNDLGQSSLPVQAESEEKVENLGGAAILKAVEDNPETSTAATMNVDEGKVKEGLQGDKEYGLPENTLSNYLLSRSITLPTGNKNLSIFRRIASLLLEKNGKRKLAETRAIFLVDKGYEQKFRQTVIQPFEKRIDKFLSEYSEFWSDLKDSKKRANLLKSLEELLIKCVFPPSLNSVSSGLTRTEEDCASLFIHLAFENEFTRGLIMNIFSKESATLDKGQSMKFKNLMSMFREIMTDIYRKAQVNEKSIYVSGKINNELSAFWNDIGENNEQKRLDLIQRLKKDAPEVLTSLSKFDSKGYFGNAKSSAINHTDWVVLGKFFINLENYNGKTVPWVKIYPECDIKVANKSSITYSECKDYMQKLSAERQGNLDKVVEKTYAFIEHLKNLSINDVHDKIYYKAVLNMVVSSIMSNIKGDSILKISAEIEGIVKDLIGLFMSSDGTFTNSPPSSEAIESVCATGLDNIKERFEVLCQEGNALPFEVIGELVDKYEYLLNGNGRDMWINGFKQVLNKNGDGKVVPIIGLNSSEEANLGFSVQAMKNFSLTEDEAIQSYSGFFELNKKWSIKNQPDALKDVKDVCSRNLRQIASNVLQLKLESARRGLKGLVSNDLINVAFDDGFFRTYIFSVLESNIVFPARSKFLSSCSLDSEGDLKKALSNYIHVLNYDGYGWHVGEHCLYSCNRSGYFIDFNVGVWKDISDKNLANLVSECPDSVSDLLRGFFKKDKGDLAFLKENTNVRSRKMNYFLMGGFACVFPYNLRSISNGSVEISESNERSQENFFSDILLRNISLNLYRVFNANDSNKFHLSVVSNPFGTDSILEKAQRFAASGFKRFTNFFKEKANQQGSNTFINKMFGGEIEVDNIRDLFSYFNGSNEGNGCLYRVYFDKKFVNKEKPLFNGFDYDGPGLLDSMFVSASASNTIVKALKSDRRNSGVFGTLFQLREGQGLVDGINEMLGNI